MAGKFMRVKKLFIPVMAAIILTSQLTGCATVPSNVMLEMLNNGQDIEITMAIPDYEVTNVGEMQALSDVQLDQLQTYIDGGFRGDFDTLFGIKPIELSNFNSKSGCIYVDKSGIQEGNTSFMDSLRNKVFMETYLGNAEVQSKLSQLAEKAYTDVDTDSAEAYLASLNAYYNLLSDNAKSDNEYFNSTQSLSRGDFYSFVYRATNPVNTLLKIEGDFKTKVNTQEPSALYASQVDQHAWLNADNDGLRTGNYTQSISRAEAVYMVVNKYFPDELKSIDPSSIKLSDAKDGGDFLEDTLDSKKESDQLYSTEKKSDNKTMAKGYQLGVISKMLKSQDDTVQTDLYKSLGVANKLNLIDSETRFNEPISKAEAIELLINTAKALNTRDGYTSELAEGDYSMFIFEADGPGVENGPSDDDIVEDFGEMPPVETTYNPKADLNNDGHVDKAEWDKWVAANPSDTNKDLIISDAEKEAANPSKPAGGNNTSKPSTGGNTNTSKPQTPPATSKPETPPATSKPETPPAPSKPETPPATSKPTTVTSDTGVIYTPSIGDEPPAGPGMTPEEWEAFKNASGGPGSQQ